MSNLLSVRQVAIRRYIKENKLKAIKVGGNVRIEEKSLEGFKNEIVPISTKQENIIKIKKTSAKIFTEENPFLRLKGRGASI